MSIRFFSYDNDSDGFRDHENLEAARERTQDNLQDALDHLDMCDSLGLICWGEIREQVQMVDDGPGDGENIRYELRSLPVPDDQPAWRDRPTVPGLYLTDRGRERFTKAWIDLQPAWEGRVYGPIPPDPKGRVVKPTVRKKRKRKVAKP